MKGLRKYLPPFAPDISGASSVLYEMGGILVICDAGGCTGNVCGFDEPRWFVKRSCIFSAGLRDMDAIFGRDDKLVEKLKEASEQIKAEFACVIGTPVPAVIGTDYHALKRMAEKKVSLPVLTVETTGMRQYDIGEELAYMELFRTFAKEQKDTESGMFGVIGATPLSVSDLEFKKKIEEKLKRLNDQSKKDDIFATGTPISNSMVEMYTMQRYLQYNNIKFHYKHHFDFE